MRGSWILALWLCAAPSFGAAPIFGAAPLPPPPLPARVPAPGPAVPNPNADRSALQPRVTIRHEKGREVEEYRINGQLYMVKIIPKFGPPYYLVDTTGDGHLDARMSHLNPKIMVPQWVLFRW
ncbi:MAG: hypothetical protein B7Z66_02255 [Chromatiales bacterium 21-64-14]|nr:MAG: hypothetical protein B7Z66_02255 [Chromatiales bacterium 21-64-14]